jgi:WD40 repeat protein
MNSDRKFKFTVICLPVVTAALLTGCGSTPVRPTGQTGPTGPGSPDVVSVVISPATAGVRKGDAWTFTAQVAGSSNTDVGWSIQEGSSGGSIDASGLYTAPPATGVYHVVAKSKADTTKTSTATVYVSTTGFSLVGNLSFPRLQHTASLLSNGKVLIAGGGEGPDLIDGYKVVSQSETFDPVAGSFASAGTLSRDAHTATVLNNGDVLFAGGEVGWNNILPIVSNTAEFWNQSNAVDVSTANMATVREAHDATLLNDGRVLITGGLVLDGINWNPLSEAEIYDPSTETFSVTGNMSLARAGHTATLLGNGKVLIAGGAYPYSTVSAELYDPATGAFASTGPMNFPRSLHTATLLPNGKVLIAGGDQTAAELYDPATGSFTVTGNMNIKRVWHTATLLPDGTVLIAGGYTSNNGTATTEIYNPETGSFTAGPTMRQARFSHTATLLPDGRVLFVGGADGSPTITVLASAEVYQ